MISRRRCVSALLSGALAPPLAALAQQAAGKVPRIGFLVMARNPGVESAFPRRLGELGYVDGRDVIIEWRSADGRSDQMATLAAELVALGVAIIVAAGPEARIAAMKATSAIPIVTVGGIDAVAEGWAASLTGCGPRRPNPQGRRESESPPGRTSDKVRAGHQREDRQGPGSDDPAIGPAPRRRGDSVKARCADPAPAGGSGDRVRRQAASSGGATCDGGAGLLAFLVDHRGHGPGEALAFAEHRRGDDQTHHRDHDGHHQEPTEDRVIAHNSMLPPRLADASLPIAEFPGFG